jgi:hypothetical protein
VTNRENFFNCVRSAFFDPFNKYITIFGIALPVDLTNLAYNNQSKQANFTHVSQGWLM